MKKNELEKWIFVLYRNPHDKELYIGQVIGIEDNHAEINPEYALERTEWYTDTEDIHYDDIIKVLPEIKSVIQQIEEKYSHYCI